MKILVTGAGGFIGSHLCKKLLALGHKVDGLDVKFDLNFESYEIDRTMEIWEHPDFTPINEDVNDFGLDHRPYDVIYHLAASTGVRQSGEDVNAYFRNNVQGMQSILNIAKKDKAHLIYASSSSVYGNNFKEVPSRELDETSYPKSYYAATKKAGEVLAFAHSSHLGMKITGARFFTVYGPWGRKDMAPWMFTDAIINDRPIKVFGNGEMYRDFTYVDDVVNGLVKLMGRKSNGHDIFNIGNSDPVKLMDFVNILEETIGKEAIIEFAPQPPGDVGFTSADMGKFKTHFADFSSTPIEAGILKFVTWFKNYNNICT